MKVGAKIRAARHAKNLTMDELGRRMGVSMQTVWRWEHDWHQPDLSTLGRIANELDVDAAALLDGERPNQGGTP